MNCVVIMPYGREDCNKKYLAQVKDHEYIYAGAIVVYTNPSGYESVGISATANFPADDTVLKLWGADSNNLKTIVAQLYRHDIKDDEPTDPEIPEVEAS